MVKTHFYETQQQRKIILQRESITTTKIHFRASWESYTTQICDAVYKKRVCVCVCENSSWCSMLLLPHLGCFLSPQAQRSSHQASLLAPGEAVGAAPPSPAAVSSATILPPLRRLPSSPPSPASVCHAAPPRPVHTTLAHNRQQVRQRRRSDRYPITDWEEWWGWRSELVHSEGRSSLVSTWILLHQNC